ncbi:hypothetical protein E4Z66_07780 [Aliishimia ponticola]|uniref:Uncharacterized protein n=1 Tax=Aliishimia ponticola TaxID=2499833 RepID=A0A4S4NE60_9RHOB|nr:hypothetical protein [Aliishimia ponticola]THH36837.1 hypothetical protein E4Z66_07780 [Aliishimia ponticola]
MSHKHVPYLGAILAVGFTQPLFAHADEAHDRLALFASYVAKDAVVGEPSIVDCTPSDGTETSCFVIAVSGEPEGHTIGPWCPTNILQTGKDAGGIWLDNGEVYEVDGPFISKLDQFYDDPVRQLFNPETGEIRVTGTLEGCRAAARPNVDPDENNFCVQCEISFLTQSTEQNYVLPGAPVFGDETTPVTDTYGTGIAFSGARIDGPAPRDAILAAHTLAPFDDCGGHVTPAVGYRYHANDPAANAILPCHTAATGCSLSGWKTTCDATLLIKAHGPGARDDV